MDYNTNGLSSAQVANNTSDTGFMNSVGDFINNIGIVGCSITILAFVALSVAVILFFSRRKMSRPRLALVFSLGAFVFALGLITPSIATVANATHRIMPPNITTDSSSQIVPPKIIIPFSFDEAFAKAGKKKSVALDGNEYYKMQDMTSDICKAVSIPNPYDARDAQQSILVDVRDGKIYGVVKLADGKCWMNQNLDLDLSTDKPLTPNDSDVSSLKWTPERGTFAPGEWSHWKSDPDHPYSYNPGEKNIGNFYNWSAAVAENDTSYLDIDPTGKAVPDFVSCPIVLSHCYHYNPDGRSAPDSICPRGWHLPAPSEFGTMLIKSSYGVAHLGELLSNPINWTNVGSFYFSGVSGYWSNTLGGKKHAFHAYFGSGFIDPRAIIGRDNGYSVRCIARG